jgi:hypothetical protein
MLKVPAVLTCNTRMKLSREWGPFLPRVFSAAPIPAQFTTVFNLPNLLEKRLE